MQLSKVFSIIPKRRLKQIPLIIVAMIIGAAFEVVGIGLILPLIDIISNNDNVFTEFLETNLPSLSSQNIILLSVAMFVGVNISKGLYLSGLAWLNGRFLYAVKAEVSNTLMNKFMIAPYEFHLKNNSAQLIRNLTTESTQLVGRVLMPILSIVTELIVLVAISLFLLAIQPIGTIVVLVLLVGLSFGFQRILARYTTKLGQIRQDTDGMLIQSSQEALNGIKDVKALGKEQHFFKRFKRHNMTLSAVFAKQYIVNQIPRMYLETVGVVIFSILIFVLIVESDDFHQVIPTLGVFALAAFRTFPSANRILSALNSLRFGDSVVVSLYNQLNRVDLIDPYEINTKTNNTLSSFNKTIEIDSLCYVYPGSKELALSNINLTIKKGESIGIIGKSGAGKSTLSDTILGLLKPSSGAVYVDGINIYVDIKSWQNLIGYVQQDIYIIDDSICRNIAFGEADDKVDHNRINNAIIEAQLSEFVSSLPEGINTNLGERGARLSGGQKQRIGIARALYRNSPILVFDEATSSLDNETETEIVSAIKRFKGVRTTIVIAHRLSTIEYCDRVIELKKGRILKVEERKK